MQYSVYTHIWTYTIELDYLVQMLDKVWVICVQFSHLCMCDKINFPPLHFTMCSRLQAFPRQPAYFIHSVREGIFTYIHIWWSWPSIYICMWTCCVCVRARVWAFFSCSSNMSTFVLFVFGWLFFCLLFSNEVACAAPKTVIHFLSKVAVLFA